MDAPDGGNATEIDAQIEQEIRILKSHLTGAYRQFERIERLFKLRQIRTVAIPEQQHRR